jgi:hypothetical protein
MATAPTHTRKKRSGSEQRKRKPSIGFRASDEEQATIEAYADRAGLTVSSYVRDRSLAKPTTRAVRRPPVATAQLAQLLGLIGAVGGDLQRMAGHLQGGELVPAAEIQASITAFREAASAILKTLGKRRHDH